MTSSGLKDALPSSDAPKDSFTASKEVKDSFSPRDKWLRVGLHAGWMVLLSVGMELRVGRFGFHPSDQGFILAQSWRILHGEIPHADVISARPLGSAVLHTVDFLLPGPLFVASGMLSMLQITVATVALAVLVTRRPLWTWGPGLTGLVVAAALVNVNSFPLMAWHTVDGILLVAIGALALDHGLRTGRTVPRWAGLLLFGVAVFVKQSFVLAAVIGALWVLLHPATREGALRTARWWRARAADALWLGAFGLAYVGVVTLAGGFGALVDQLTGGLPACAERLTSLSRSAQVACGEQLPFGFIPPPPPEPTPIRNLLVFAALATILLLVRLLRDRLGVVGRLADWALVLAGTALVGWVVYRGEFVGASRWADLLWWITLAAIVANGLSRRRVPWAALLVFALGLMISLSWGQDTPTLIAGSLALTTVLLLADGAPPLDVAAHRTAWLVTGTAFGLAVALAAGLFVVDRHDKAPYLDLPQGQLTRDLGELTPAMQGIRTNPGTYAFIEQIGDCVREFPADRVAVLPDNTFAYPAFSLRNPFPLEWPLPFEIVADAPQRMLATADALNREGSYLVLFQTTHPGALGAGAAIGARATPDTPIFDYVGLEKAIKHRLTGQTVTCGNFVGKWAR